MRCARSTSARTSYSPASWQSTWRTVIACLAAGRELGPVLRDRDRRSRAGRGRRRRAAASRRRPSRWSRRARACPRCHGRPGVVARAAPAVDHLLAAVVDAERRAARAGARDLSREQLPPRARNPGGRCPRSSRPWTVIPFSMFHSDGGAAQLTAPRRAQGRRARAADALARSRPGRAELHGSLLRRVATCVPTTVARRTRHRLAERASTLAGTLPLDVARSVGLRRRRRRCA